MKAPAHTLQPVENGPLTLVRSFPYVDLFAGQPEEGDSWARVSDLCDLKTGMLAQALQAMAEVRDYSPDDGRTLGSSFVLISATALLPFIALLMEGEGALRMTPATTWWRIAPSANVRAIAVADVQVEAAPSLERAEPGDLESVRSMMRDALDPLYEAIRRLTRVPLRAQWALTESCIAGWLLSERFDRSETAVSVANSLFADGDVLWRSRPRFWDFEAKGKQHTAYTRRVCCYNFNKMNKKDPCDGYCGSMCPLIPPPERLKDAVQRVTTEQRETE